MRPVSDFIMNTQFAPTIALESCMVKETAGFKSEYGPGNSRVEV